MPKKIDIIRHFVRKTLKSVNQQQAIDNVRNKFNIGKDERSLQMNIIDVGDLFFVMGDHQIVMPDTLPNPTATVIMLEDTFIKISKKRLTFDEAYWYSQMEVRGDFWLRDLIIFREIFKEYGDKILEE